MVVSVENKSKEILRLSGKVAKLVFIPTKLSLQGKVYTANGETSNRSTLVLMVPAVVEEMFFLPDESRVVNDHGWVQTNDSSEMTVSVQNSRQNPSHLIIVLRYHITVRYLTS